MVLFSLSFFLNIFVELPKYLNACSYNQPPLSTRLANCWLELATRQKSRLTSHCFSLNTYNTVELHRLCNNQRARFECGNIVGSSPDRAKPLSKTVKFVCFYFSAQHAALRKKSKDLLTRNQDDVSLRMMQRVYPRTVVFSELALSNLVWWSSTNWTLSSSH